MKTFARGPEEGHLSIKKIVLDLFPAGLKGLKILDAAAGNGSFTKVLVNLGADVVAVDNDVEQWRANQVKCENIDLNQTLYFENGTFDVIISIETIEHLENPWKMLREFSRILKVDGVMIISTPNTHCVRSKLKYLITGYPVLFEFSEGDLDPDEFHLQPVTIGHFIWGFKVNDIRLLDVFSIPWVKTPWLTRIFLYACGRVLNFIRRFVRKKHLPSHYLNILSPQQISRLDLGEQLIVVGRRQDG